MLAQFAFLQIIHRQPGLIFQLEGAHLTWASILDDLWRLDRTWIPLGRQILHPWIFFSFWGFIKTEVYERPVENLNRLKCRTLTAVRMVNNMLANTWMKLMSRHQLLRDNGGRHIEVY